MTDSRKNKLLYLVAGLLVGASAFAAGPAVGHVGDNVGHLWEDHLLAKAKAEFYTKAQTNKKFFTKKQTNQNFVNIGEAADVARDVECTGCIERNRLTPEQGWIEVTQFEGGQAGPRFGNEGGNFETAGYRKDFTGEIHLKGTVKVIQDPTQSGALVFNLPEGFRPAGGTRVFLVPKSVGVGMSTIAINPFGQVTIYPNTGQVGDTYSLDGISFHP